MRDGPARGDGPRPLRVILASPRGFCAGVTRAVSIVERALRMYGPPVYVLHEIVHNRHVVDALRQRGAVFVDEIAQIPPGSVTVFSAHGVAQFVEEDAREAALDVIDATCPLVHKVHHEGRNFAAAGYEVVLIGHPGHVEVEGTIGQIPGRVHVVADVAAAEALQLPDTSRVAYITQTTLSYVDAQGVIAVLKRRFPGIVGPNSDDICYATQNRQAAVLALVRAAPLVLVVGSASSSNANRLRELAEQAGAVSHLIEDRTCLDPAWLQDVHSVGVTSGASTPDALVFGLIDRLSELRATTVEFAVGAVETVEFKMPRRLSTSAAFTNPAATASPAG